MATNQQPQNLMMGSRGPEVSDLQNTLKQHGLYNGPIDGVYGPQTQSAVQNFQNISGIKTDGIYGPQTTSTLDAWSKNPIKFAIADPVIQQRMQQNPLFAQTMNQLAASGGNQADTIAAAHLISKNSGGAVNYFDANGNFNPDVFKQAALGYLSPEINQSFKYYANDFAQGLQNEKQQYQSQLASTQLGQQQQSQQFQTQQGSTNQVNTGAGQQMRQSFYNNQNQQLAGLQSQAQTTLSGLACNRAQSRYG